MIPVDKTFEEIMVGDTASFTRVFTEDDIRAFAELSGDQNPLHLDAEYAKTTQFGKPLVHGMLVASLCSTLVGMHLPGKRCLYLGQTLVFRKPVYAGDELTVTGTVAVKTEATHLLEIKIQISNGTEDVVTGMAMAQVI